ncbi:MAG: NHLP bacteriocin export ABC transporter permease/ATPase subunit [Clostridiales Family XIII bacterium]|nr:NHLP bacteriocin export ABC transporter permease/ATPase subunit [Clostridiales Family XIII bacterium]
METKSSDEKTVRANRRRYYNEDRYLQNAFDILSRVIPGKAKKGDIPDLQTDSLLVKACAAVAKSMHIKFTVTEAMADGNLSSDPLRDISEMSRFRTRKVMLSGKWYTQNGGSFLGRLTDEQGNETTPVALIQKTSKSYLLYNPESGTRVKVTQAVAETLSPQAVMFYRTLPREKVSPKQLLRFMMESTDRSDWIFVGMLGIAGGLLGMLTPEITGIVFDTVIPNGNRNLLLQIGILLAAIALVSFAFELTRGLALQRITGKTELSLQAAVWDRLLSLPVNFFRGYTAGSLTMSAMGISQIRGLLSGMVINTVFSGLFSVFYIIVLFTKGGSLAWIGIAILLVTLLISFGLCLRQVRYERQALTLNNTISGKMFGWLGGIAKIRMSGSEKRTFHNWAQLFGEVRILTFRKERLGNIGTVFNTVVVLLSSILIYIAMMGRGEAAITTGSFIAFNVALQQLLMSCISISMIAMQLNVVVPMFKKMQPIFETEPEYDEEKADPGELSGEVEVSHINFRYTENGPPILRDVSLTVRQGEHVALVGPSGSGKSTLLRILLGFEKPDSGEIYFDGMEMKKMDIRLLRKQFGVVLQSSQLLAGNIFENIAGANPDLTQDDAMEAIRKVGLEEDMEQMPMGLHTVLSDGAGTLSGGQRQRLLIARALASNPKILFFDEATSALDNRSQKIVSDSVNRLKTTRITIAHRLSTVMECDKIVVLEDGVITETGTYRELMDLGGAFASMAKRQMI